MTKGNFLKTFIYILAARFSKLKQKLFFIFEISDLKSIYRISYLNLY